MYMYMFLTETELKVHFNCSYKMVYHIFCLKTYNRQISVKRTLLFGPFAKVEILSLSRKKVLEWKLNKMDNLCLKTDECRR